MRFLLKFLGFGMLVTGGMVIAAMVLFATLLLGPLVFWLSWNVLNFAHAVGLPELGFWGIVLATLFLVSSWFPKIVIAGIVFLADPNWFKGGTQVHWPNPNFKNFVAVALLALLAARPHAHAKKSSRRYSSS